MRPRRTTSLAAIGLALTIAASAAAASPATGTWGALTTSSGPALWGPGQPGIVHGVHKGPDGKLYIFGNFQNAGGDPTADHLAVFNPATGTVHGLGSNGAGNGAFNDRVYAVTWVNGILYAGGAFASAAGIAGVDGLAAWNGTSWSGRGMPAASDVTALATANGHLYVGGSFANAGDAFGDNLSDWDGYTWTSLGSNGAGNGALNAHVWTLAALPDGRVYAGGSFTSAGGNVEANYAAWFDPGSDSWEKIGTAAGSPLNAGVWTMALIGNRVILGGAFSNAGGLATADAIAEWTGTAWKAYGSDGAGGGALVSISSLYVNSVAVYGSNILVSGLFDSTAGVEFTDGIAVWNGSKWMALAQSNPTNDPWFLEAIGRDLYVTGSFTNLGAIPAADGIGVYGLPAAPSAARSLAAATAGSKKVKLTWAAPATSNGAPVTDYVIKYRKLGALSWSTFVHVASTLKTATIAGLTSGATYQFQVFAKNDWGTAAGSAIVVKKAL